MVIAIIKVRTHRESVKFNAAMSVYKSRELRTLKNKIKLRLKMSINIFTNVYKYLYTFANDCYIITLEVNEA